MKVNWFRLYIYSRLVSTQIRLLLHTVALIVLQNFVFMLPLPRRKRYLSTLTRK
jgi:hypothetical protein